LSEARYYNIAVTATALSKYIKIGSLRHPKPHSA